MDKNSASSLVSLPLITLIFSLLLSANSVAQAKGLPAYVGEASKFEAQQNFGQALLVYDRACKQNPNDLNALWNRVRLTASLENMNISMADCDRLIQADPQCRRFADLYTFRACAYKDEDQPQKALLDLDKSIALGQHSPLLYICRAQCYLAMDKYQQALESTTELINRYKQPQSYPNEMRARCLEALNQPEKALADWNRAVELEPHNDACYSGRVRVLERLHKLDAAIADYTHLINSHPKDETLLYLRAKVYFNAGKCKEALADLNKSISMDPVPSATVYELRAKVYDKLGKAQEAKRDRESASKVRI